MCVWREYVCVCECVCVCVRASECVFGVCVGCVVCVCGVFVCVCGVWGVFVCVCGDFDHMNTCVCVCY